MVSSLKSNVPPGKTAKQAPVLTPCAIAGIQHERGRRQVDRLDVHGPLEAEDVAAQDGTGAPRPGAWGFAGGDLVWTLAAIRLWSCW